MNEAFEKIGSRIRELRKACGLSQQSLAEKAGISYKYLGEVERGVGKLSVRVLLQIAGALRADASELLDVERSESANLSRAKYILSELPERELAVVLDMMESLKRHLNDS
ncbi:MAG: helix-turn-helix transcriptional regulator [Desulfovibrionaceae bacterium]|nr:helix-turn-helix transcriptional regulator [Desulfovibrionaceae bacterium]